MYKPVLTTIDDLTFSIANERRRLRSEAKKYLKAHPDVTRETIQEERRRAEQEVREKAIPLLRSCLFAEILESEVEKEQAQ